MSTTYEQAKRCPKCGVPGKVTAQTTSRVFSPITRTAPKVETISCVNKACAWFDTSWIVQINPDGSVPTEDYSKTEDKRFK